MSLYRNFPTIVAGSITAGNALIDSTTANAFCAPVGVDLSPYRNRLIEFWSTEATPVLWAQAWISATAPSEETYLEKLLNPSFTGTWASNVPQSWSLNGTQTGTSYLEADDAGDRLRIVSDGLVMGVYQTSRVTPTGTLQLGSIVVDSITGRMRAGCATSDVSNFPFPNIAAAGTYTKYYTVNLVTDPSFYLLRLAGYTCDAWISDTSVKNVLTPAATGALLLSTQGGSRGWQYKHASFNPNAALTYRISSHMKVGNPRKFMGVSTFHN